MWPRGAHEVPSSCVPCPGSVCLGALPYVCETRTTLRAPFILSLPQSLKQLFLRGSLGPFSSEWYVDAQVWALAVSKARKAEDGV